MPESNTNTKDFVSWLNFYLRVTGIRPTFRFRLVDDVRVLYYILAISLCGVCCWVLVGRNYSDISLNTDSLIYAVMAVHSLYVYCVYLRHRKKLCRMVTLMQSRFRNPSEKPKPGGRYEEIWRKSDDLSLLLVKYNTIFNMSVVCFYFFNASPFSSERKLVFSMWVPFSLDSDVNYFSVYCFQVSVFVLYVCIHVCGNGLCVGGAHFIGAAFDVLGQSFRDMCENRVTFGSNGGVSPSNRRIQLGVDERFKFWVNRHTTLLRLVEDYKSVFQSLLFELMLSSQIIICFSGFQMVLALEVIELQRAGVLLGTALILVFHMLTFCYPGQHIYNKSEQMRHTLYASQWEQQSPLFQKHLCFILTRTLKPVDINYKNTLHLSMSSLLQALRTAFSYINILLILRKPN